MRILFSRALLMRKNEKRDGCKSPSRSFLRYLTSSLPDEPPVSMSPSAWPISKCRGGLVYGLENFCCVEVRWKKKWKKRGSSSSALLLPASRRNLIFFLMRSKKKKSKSSSRSLSHTPSLVTPASASRTLWEGAFPGCREEETRKKEEDPQEASLAVFFFSK